MSFKISVAICTYNGEKYVREQLESIIDQTRRPDEIVLCDDCSTDKTVTIVQNTLKESGINFRVIKNSINLGFIKNFEKAISLCQGDIIFISDQDDFWLQNKIEKTEKIFLDDDKCMLVFSDMEIVDKNLSKRGYSTWNLLGINEHLTDIDILKMIAQSKDIFNGCAMAIRSSTKEVILPFTKNWGHDIWIIANIALFFDNSIRFIPDKLLLSRRHENNTASFSIDRSIRKSKSEWWKKPQKAFKHIKKSSLYNRERYYAFITQLENKKKVIDRRKANIFRNIYDFWEEKASLGEKNLLVGLSLIIRGLNKGVYQYQNNVFKAVVKDALYLFLHRAKKIYTQIKHFQYLVYCRFASNKQVFTEIYKKKRWGISDELPYNSGAGSKKLFSEPYAKIITQFIQQNNIKSVVDLGCGDFTVARNILQQNKNIKYTGIDVVDELISYLNKHYGLIDKIKFEVKDITKDKLPGAELYLVRQVFQHLSNKDISKAIKNIPLSSHLIITEHQLIDTSIIPNKDMHHWSGIRIYNDSAVYLDKAPFDLKIKELLKIKLNERECLSTFLVERDTDKLNNQFL